MFIIFLILDIWTHFAIPRSFIMFSIVSDDASYNNNNNNNITIFMQVSLFSNVHLLLSINDLFT